jgi:hypothetical protein
MEAFIALSSEERGQYCRQASERMDVPFPAAVVEKDFWVCWTLKTLLEIPELKGNITFKGGTSLSKAWGLIERFSEDIDLAINRKVFGHEPPHGAEDAASNRQRRLKLEELEQKNSEFVRHVLLPKLHEIFSVHLDPQSYMLRAIQKGKEVNIEFEYPGALKNELGGLLPVVLIELVPRADEIPNEERTITPIIHQVFGVILGDGSFSVPTLAPERTFLEKLLLIHETLEGFNTDGGRKSRHYYDLLKLYNAGVFEKVRSNPELLKIVVEHRYTFFRYNAMNYEGIFTKGIRLVPTFERRSEWGGDYGRNAVMIYNNIPSFEEVMVFAQRFETEFNEWVSNTF